MDDESLHSLIDGWRGCGVEAAPYLFPGDSLEEIGQSGVAVTQLTSHADYVKDQSFGDDRDTSLHLGLLPVPYVGNLEQASVFILMINPGLGPGDYYAEYNVPGYREALISNLRQENGQNDYPFFGLDPNLAVTGAFDYWHGRLKGIVSALKDQRGCSYLAALRDLAHKIACLQLMPYHSQAFRAHKLIDTLKSTELARDYVEKVLKPRAENDEISIVIARQGEKWGLEPGKNVVVYQGSECRGAYLGPKTSGGPLIKKRLGL